MADRPSQIPLQPGQVLLVQRQWVIGRIIQRVTGSLWTHAALASGPNATIEAHDLHGVREIPDATGEYLADQRVVALRVFRWSEPFEVAPALAKAREYLRKATAYSVPDLLRVYLYEEFQDPDLDRADLDGDAKQICSELVARCGVPGGQDVRLQYGLTSFGLITPARLAASVCLVPEWGWIR